MWRRLINSRVRERLKRIELPFSRYDIDPYGISRDHLGLFYTFLDGFYRYYFRVRCYGIENVPLRGRAMVVGNHSGGLPVDGGMVLASLFFEPEVPRHAHGMVEYFAQNWPFVSQWFSRVGQLPGLPEHAIRLLEDDRVLMVFPEGVRGTGKLYKDRYKLARFGTGFMRIAMRTQTPIVPLAFIGGEEALPTVFHFRKLARAVGAPYWPVPPYGIPLPLPFQCSIHYGKPMQFEGDGNESDQVISSHVEQVRNRIALLIEEGRAHRKRLLPWLDGLREATGNGTREGS
ncbi:MAG: 1-acyl-sn-glycerol-3-phosphate acyltransferase [Bradymonadales bacterium]|nr:1-acyl-sn-glycerol-3-phosphate acyltransferase [Bradymonadales bacterium]